MQSGERYCLLIDEASGVPLFYPNLFITTQIRNKSLSYSSMEAAISAISVLLKYSENHHLNIEERFKAKNLLKVNEIDSICDYCQKNFNESALIKNSIGSETEYTRITIIANYLTWMADYLNSNHNDHLFFDHIEKMKKGFKARRPVRKNRNSGLTTKGLTTEQIAVLFEIFRPQSDFNVFNDTSVRARNRLIFLLLYHLGLRGGELLNIRIRDIDFSKNQLVIVRRADEKDDPRKYQPLVKTLDRRLPVKDTLIKQIHEYILKERKKARNASKHDFLLVTHKAGPTEGMPLSKSGYKNIMKVIRDISPTLFNLTGHQLRHTWNEVFSNHMDSMDEPINPEQQEKIRSYLMGWKEGSGTATTYNKRFITEQAHKASLSLQKNAVRAPKGGNND